MSSFIAQTSTAAIVPLQKLTAWGSPLKPESLRVLLLGSGELGKEVAISLQRLGVEVHAADRYANAPAMQVAHTAHVLNMTDADELQTLVNLVKPHYIVPEIEAIATAQLISIEERSQAIVIPSARAVHLTMNREGIRDLAAKTLDLPTSPYLFASDLATFEQACLTIGFPCFVKPVMSSSGKGQSRLTSAVDIENAWQTALEAGRVKQNRVIIEGQIEFDFEITLLTVRAYNQATGQLQTHFCDAIGHRQESGDYVESWQPQPLTPLALERAQHIADTVTTALGGAGVFGVELFIQGDNVWFSEVSPRPHDTGLVTLASQFQSEFELHARAILGLPVDTARHSVAASAVIYAGLEGTRFYFNNIAEALTVPQTDLRLFGKPEGFKKRRMGVVTARAASVEEARTRAVLAAGMIEVSRDAL